MKHLLAALLLFSILSFSQDENECDETSSPYWYAHINSKLEGENITLRNAFKKIQQEETTISPPNGFISLRLHISKTGKFCAIDTFQIDPDYEPIVFNNGKLIKQLETVALVLKG